MDPLLIEVVAAAAVGLFALALVLQPLLAGETAPEPPSALDDLVDPEETPQGAAIAALREIEFDRATGKLSDEDYASLNARYTQRALEAMRAADGPATAPAAPAPLASREALERLVAARRGATARICAACGPCAEPDADFCSRCGDAVGTAACRACGAPHQPGGRFCSTCGGRLAA